MTRLLGQLLLTLVSLSAIPRAQAPEHIGIDDSAARKHRLVKAISRIENCPFFNVGCLRRGDGSYRQYPSLRAGMKALEREIERRRGHSVAWILNDFNRGGTVGYSGRVAKIAGLSEMEMLP